MLVKGEIMGGRGGKNKNGKYPTIQMYWATIYFFNGFVESSYTGGSYGKPTPMLEHDG